jgi:eukaryotic-like serine/threonine-protein kinase
MLARVGDTAAAEKLATELDRTYPTDTLLQRYWLPSIHAAVALRRNDPDRASKLLQVTSIIELSRPRLFPVYLRGEDYLRLHDGKRAAIEFQNFIDHRGLVRNSPWGALSRLGLARAYAMQSDSRGSRIPFEEFLTLWKNAEADIPVLRQARAEYASLL